MKDFYLLFIEELKKMHSAGRQIAKALPHMIRSSSSSKLRATLRHHLHDTQAQLARLEEIVSEFGETLSSGENPAVKHLLHEGTMTFRHWHQDKATRDAAIIMHMQKIQHYEIAGYGSLKAFAKHFKLPHILELLEESSKEEGWMDKKLIELAEGTFFESGINAKARQKCA